MVQACKLFTLASLMLILVFPVARSTAADETNKPTYKPARNTQGHPDLQGTWDFRTLTPLERPLVLGDKTVLSKEEGEAFVNQALAKIDVDQIKGLPAKFDVEIPYNTFWTDYGTDITEDRRTSLIVDPPNGRLPELTPLAYATLKTNTLHHPPVRDFLSLNTDNLTFRAAGPEVLGLSERCMVSYNAGPPLTPSIYNNILRIVQSPGYVVIFTEMIHTARIVPIDGRAHLPSEMTEWYGDSRGHWEGDTLVIETTNFTDKTPTYKLPLDLANFERNGVVGRGKDMHLVERFTRDSDASLIYEYTVTDLVSFTKPFTVAVPMRATDDQIYEFACHEGNHAMASILRGARTLEQEEAAAAR